MNVITAVSAIFLNPVQCLSMSTEQKHISVAFDEVLFDYHKLPEKCFSFNVLNP